MRMRTILVVGCFVVSLALVGGGLAFSGAKRSTTMNGAEECSDAGTCNQGDPDGSGLARITLNAGQATVCWELTARDIAPATASHIHKAPAGVPGPIVVPLSPPTSGSSSGCTTASPTLIADIIENPEEYYVNVHNAEYPAGAIRGQLSNRGQFN
jgi:CHRD domain-containing protein